jgi:HK97 family phage major capsid protein
MSVQFLREERARIAAQMRELSNKKDWDAATDVPAWEKATTDLDSVDYRIKAAAKADEILAEGAQAGLLADRAEQLGKDKGKDSLSQWARWLRRGDAALSTDEWQTIRNTMPTTTPSEGGYSVQTSVATRVIDSLKYFGGMRSVANVISTGMGNTIQFPSSDGTAEVGEWIGQNTTATAADVVFGSVSLPVFKASSKIVAIPFELLQDSQVDVESFVVARLATRLGRITNTGYTVGNGTTQPNGVVTAAGTGFTAANATTQVTAITYASLVEVVHSVDPAYRHGGNTKWMMNDSSIKVIRKIVDGQSRPLFAPGYDTQIPGQTGYQPDTLMGYPIVLNQDVAAMAASAKSIIFGDFNYYTIRDVMDVTMFRFADSAYAKLGQVGFLAWMRTGGNLLDTGALKLFVNAAS